ncbi:tumor protein p63-regulated gene 1-like protein isoform X3 [Narcine bancroftii]|uniref:tumor protein p63-regulated gene 1-like protein isoform X3 n=1 Tax=Narcine bancroftii TaxID=1343680 RepID=UPI0038312CBB
MIRPPAPCSSAKGGSETLAFSRGPGEGETPPQDGRRGDPALQCERWVETSPWGGREDHAAPRGSGEGGDEGKTGHSADLSHLYPPGPRGDFYPSITLCPPAKDSLDVYFALRPGVLKSVIEEMRKHLSSEDGPIKGYWLLVEIDQWNCEGERLILLTSCSLLLGHYDFVGLRCNLVRRIPLRMIDRITHGPFQFSTFSLSSRSGLGLRVEWDKLRETSVLSRWSFRSWDLPYVTLTGHPGGVKEPGLCEEIRNYDGLASLFI